MAHIGEMDLERYYLGMIKEPELGLIEEHLLWCHRCLDHEEATERYVNAMRAAAILGNCDLEVA